MINWLNTNQGAVMAVLTLVYVVATIFLVRLSNRQLHSTYLLEKARTRANPILSLEVKHYSLVVVLQNIGQTPALKISFSLSPELKTVFGGDNEVPREKREILIPFLTNGVESLAPGARVDTVIGSWRRVVEAYPGLTWSGTMTFTDMWNEVHQASVTLDARAYENRMVVARRDIHDVHAVLAKIESTFGRLLTMFRDQQVTLSVAPTKNAGAPDDSAQAEQGASPKES